MLAPVLIIIPTLDAERELGLLFSNLFEGLGSGIIREVIVPDGGSDDAAVIIAEKVGFLVAKGAKGRGWGAQICNVISLANGELVLILQADSVFKAGWSLGVDQYFRNLSKAWYFALKLYSPRPMARMTSICANQPARWFGLPYRHQGLLVSGELLSLVGGYVELPFMEDVAVVQRLIRRLNPLSLALTTSATA